MATSMEPLVTVVIPTFGRPDLVLEAVRSVLGQTMNDLEVVVVADGPEEATAEALRDIPDPRLRLISLPVNSGPSTARNAGVAAARGAWVAFLDDDDLWLPRKLEVQKEAALRSSCRLPIVACRLIARSESGDHVWPRRLPGPGEHLSEYLFRRRTPFHGEGIVHLNTVLAPRELLRDNPFDERLRHLEDYEWLLRVTSLPDVGLIFPDEAAPLAVWRIEGGRPHLSLDYAADAREFMAWARDHRNLLTGRAHASFLLMWAGYKVARVKCRPLFFPILFEAFRRGRPSFNDLFTYLAYWFTPHGLTKRLAAGFARTHTGLDRPAGKAA
jgi:glycosyltransferase involved in cell wall biosynthesis